MFVSSKERTGTAYMELQYCEKEIPIKDIFKETGYWKDTSLLIHVDDMDEFFNIYWEYIECPISPDGSSRFCHYGLNYYTKERTEEILKKLKEEKPKDSEILAKWLEECVQKYSGFFILGI